MSRLGSNLENRSVTKENILRAKVLVAPNSARLEWTHVRLQAAVAAHGEGGRILGSALLRRWIPFDLDLDLR